jgi:hypothetical protein
VIGYYKHTAIKFGFPSLWMTYEGSLMCIPFPEIAVLTDVLFSEHVSPTTLQIRPAILKHFGTY